MSGSFGPSGQGLSDPILLWDPSVPDLGAEYPSPKKVNLSIMVGL